VGLFGACIIADVELFGARIFDDLHSAHSSAMMCEHLLHFNRMHVSFDILMLSGLMFYCTNCNKYIFIVEDCTTCGWKVSSIGDVFCCIKDVRSYVCDKHVC